MRSQTEIDAILAAIQSHGATKSYAEIGALLGLPANVVNSVGLRAGFKKPSIFVKFRTQQARQRELILAHVGTHTLEQLGQLLGVTRERARQICEKWKIKREKFSSSKLRLVSDEELRKVVRQSEKPQAAMARELGVADTTLRAELNRRGMKYFIRGRTNAWLLKRGKRFCFRCKHVKPIEQFSRKTKDKSGYSCRCLKCGAAATRAWWKKNAASIKNRPPATWEEKFEAFNRFHQKHGHCNVPVGGNPGSLSRWLGRQRVDYRAGHLLPERKALLESLGFDPSGLGARLEARWEARFNKLADFKERHGHCWVTHSVNPELAAWLHEQRRASKRARISPERLRRLLEIGMEYGPKRSTQ
jgi:hypothetical protein